MISLKHISKIWAVCLLLCFVISISNKATAQTLRPSINHIAICAKDLKVSSDFYTNVLQLETIKHPFNDVVHHWYRIGPNQQLHVIQADCPAEKHDINTHMCFSVPSLEAFMKHLDQMNIKYGNWAGEPRKTQLRPDGVLQIYFQDPDGYWIEVNNAR